MSNSDAKVILCDLGGVLVELNWYEKMKRLFGSNKSRSDIMNFWLSLKSVRKFESGKSGYDDFYNDFLSETGLQIEKKAFYEDFNDIIGDLKPDCISILNEIKDSFTLAMLSNTNPLHTDIIRKNTKLFDCFDNLFFSYELGMVKPDREIFDHVAATLKTDPNKIMFFDDSKKNVTAALEAGFKAYEVQSPAQIKEIVLNQSLC